LADTRPGWRFNSALNTLPLNAGTYRVQGLGYYDIPNFERTLAARNGRLYEIQGAGVSAVNAVVSGVSLSATADVTFAQLVDKMFYTDGTTLRFSSVTTFSDASAMPGFAILEAHRFRLFAVAKDSDVIYPSGILAASTAADWVKLQSIRVGTGGGDSIRRLISGQDSNLLVLKEGSAWSVDTTESSSANWTIRKISDKVGCAAGKTAVQAGQDVYFLSRYGVVSLGGLSTTDAINATATLSAPIQPVIDRINWTAAPDVAFGVVWKNYYVLFLPLDSSTYCNYAVAFHLITKRWMPEWKIPLGDLSIDTGTTATFSGFSAGATTYFSGTQETIIGDTCGRLHRLDDTYDKDDLTSATSQDIESWVLLRAFEFGEKENRKQPFCLWVEFDKCTSSDLTVCLVPDAAVSYPKIALGGDRCVEMGFSGSNQPKFPFKLPLKFSSQNIYRRKWLLMKFPKFNELQIQVVSKKGKIRLREVMAAAFVETVNVL
jgi:hypothetical protein